MPCSIVPPTAVRMVHEDRAWECEPASSWLWRAVSACSSWLQGSVSSWMHGTSQQTALPPLVVKQMLRKLDFPCLFPFVIQAGGLEGLRESLETCGWYLLRRNISLRLSIIIKSWHMKIYRKISAGFEKIKVSSLSFLESPCKLSQQISNVCLCLPELLMAQLENAGWDCSFPWHGVGTVPDWSGLTAAEHIHKSACCF